MWLPHIITDGPFGGTMESFWFAAYLVLLALASAQAVLLALQTWEHRRYARSSMRSLGAFRPHGHVSVFAPCKGIDVDLHGNFSALMRQDCADYDVTFIVESEEDPACEVIRRVMAEHPRVTARLVVAGRATRCGQKTHNLRAATAGLAQHVEYLLFVDSDARPRPEWVRMMIRRLNQPDVGAVTGYRWLMPVRSSWSNHLLYSINCVIMSLLGKTGHCMIWGGSWGIRREVFDSIDLPSVWEGTLSDDLAASRVLRRRKLEVPFEPGCVVGSPADYRGAEMLSFLRRQYFLGRCYVPDWWLFGLAVSTLSSLTWLANLAALVFGLAWGTPPVWIPACALGVFYLLSVLRGAVRQDLIRTYFPGRQRELKQAKRFDTWMAPLVALTNWLGLLASAFGSHVTWRGIRYRVNRNGRVLFLQHEDEASCTCGNEERHRQGIGVHAAQHRAYSKTG